ncbi:MAG: hypothetical protein A4E70_02531 [Syntrophus sp. PtaU1.Bin005]|nr:MAG: hypothetical protein A4E70_02531 [Syntrophus sp. PtaU1.Bin005]
MGEEESSYRQRDDLQEEQDNGCCQGPFHVYVVQQDEIQEIRANRADENKDRSLSGSRPPRLYPVTPDT